MYNSSVLGTPFGDKFVFWPSSQIVGFENLRERKYVICLGFSSGGSSRPACVDWLGCVCVCCVGLLYFVCSSMVDCAYSRHSKVTMAASQCELPMNMNQSTWNMEIESSKPSFANTIIILDWDDTLLASSWLASKGLSPFVQKPLPKEVMPFALAVIVSTLELYPDVLLLLLWLLLLCYVTVVGYYKFPKVP